MEENKYYILDCGEQMREYCEAVQLKLRIEKCHFIVYDTDAPYYFGIERVTEDVFLSHFLPQGQA